MLPESSVVPPLTLHDFMCVANYAQGLTPSRIPSINTGLPAVKRKINVVFQITESKRAIKKYYTSITYSAVG